MLKQFLDAIAGGFRKYRKATGVDWVLVQYGEDAYWRRRSEVYSDGIIAGRVNGNILVEEFWGSGGQ